ncbi:hypothetical protein SMNI109538_02765 [Smaragdicoccus niigatensis]
MSPASVSHMSTDPQALAAKLLDAHVQHLVAEVTDRFADTVSRELDWALETAATLKLAEVVNPADVKAAARLGIDKVGEGSLIDELIAPSAEMFYNLPAASDNTLGDVVDRDKVEKIVEAVLRNRAGQNRFLDKLLESPSAALVASAFTGKIVDGIVGAQRQKAEKIPGMGSAFSLGGKLASAAAKATNLDKAADRGAVMALKVTEQAVRELLKDGPLKQAAMEIWDLHANEPISEQRKYATLAEVQEIAELGHQIAKSSRDRDYVLAVVDGGIDMVFKLYGDTDLKTLLDKTGLAKDDLAKFASLLGPTAIAKLNENGVLAAEIRKRLEPFYLADSTIALLSE